jgi:serine protease Do
METAIAFALMRLQSQSLKIERIDSIDVVLNLKMRVRTFGNFFKLALAGVALLIAQVVSAVEDVDIRRDAVVAAVGKVMPSVVNIATESLVPVRDLFDEMFGDFWRPYHRQQSQYSLGSGVIIDEDGYILTNDHVVRRANKIWVKLSGGSEIYLATNIVTDPKTDIAILKIIGAAENGEKIVPLPAGMKFKAVQFAADDDLLLGETVLSMGNPFGLGGSVSRGILSSKSRIAPSEGEQLDVPNWLQTDASINPGNSGGPLVNLRGELIGLNVAILREAQGIGFAIPAKRVRQAISEVFTPEAVQQLWFGARLKSESGSLVVAKIQPGSPADKAALQSGDRVLQVNGKTPRSIFEFVRELSVNPRATLVVMRAQQRKTINVQLLPENSVFNADLVYEKLGIKLRPNAEGFVVESLDKNAPAAKVLQPGFFVLAIDGKPLNDLTSAAKFLYTKKKGDAARLTVAVQWRQGAITGLSQDDVQIPVLR